MSYKRKTCDVWVMESNYGDGWEPEVEESSWKEIRARLREYRENAPQYQYRARKHRELISAEVDNPNGW